MDVFNANLVTDYFQMVVVNKILLKDVIYALNGFYQTGKKLFILNIHDSDYHLVALRSIIQENVLNTIKVKGLNLQKKDLAEYLIV